MCRGGLGNHCRDRTVLGISGRDGVFAEFVAVPVANLHHVPDAVGDEQAVFVEPLAAAFQITRQVRFDGDQETIVLGDGRLGQLVARVLKLFTRRLVLVGKHDAKLEAAEKQGIQTVRLERFVPGAGAAVVVDATGTADGFDTAMRTVRPRGTIVLKSTFAAAGGMNLSPLVINEVTVVGSRCGPFAQAIKALAEGKVDVAGMISRRFRLDQIVGALDAAQDSESLKVLIDVGQGR
jgi:threonine dehydrogenase-like Zn-dependent dehydrogenase